MRAASRTGLGTFLVASLIVGCATSPPTPMGLGTISFKTQDSRHQAYFNQARDKIRANWIYPREAGEKEIEGTLEIEFHIATDGHLESIALRHSSGVRSLDDYAMTAVKLAQPFPPVPADLAKQTLSISSTFRYQITRR